MSEQVQSVGRVRGPKLELFKPVRLTNTFPFGDSFAEGLKKVNSEKRVLTSCKRLYNAIAN